MHDHGKVGFNKEYVKSLDKETFVKEFGALYPHLNLEAEYDKIVPPAKEEKAPVKQIAKPGKSKR